MRHARGRRKPRAGVSLRRVENQHYIASTPNGSPCSPSPGMAWPKGCLSPTWALGLGTAQVFEVTFLDSLTSSALSVPRVLFAVSFLFSGFGFFSRLVSPRSPASGLVVHALLICRIVQSEAESWSVVGVQRAAATGRKPVRHSHIPSACKTSGQQQPARQVRYFLPWASSHVSDSFAVLHTLHQQTRSGRRAEVGPTCNPRVLPSVGAVRHRRLVTICRRARRCLGMGVGLSDTKTCPLLIRLYPSVRRYVE